MRTKDHGTTLEITLTYAEAEKLYAILASFPELIDGHPGWAKEKVLNKKLVEKLDEYLDTN